mmetsp:Transcript_15527/g.31414  ORF Transcript_15527/g.31414 Transcript_15527/m.31414 type:complete len:85 (-) Transcript_15527:2790-3044(-)
MKEDEKQEQQKTEQPDEGKLDEEQKLEWASIDLKVRGTILFFPVLTFTMMIAQIFLPFYLLKNGDSNGNTGNIAERYALDLHEL